MTPTNRGVVPIDLSVAFNPQAKNIPVASDSIRETNDGDGSLPGCKRWKSRLQYHPKKSKGKRWNSKSPYQPKGSALSPAVARVPYGRGRTLEAREVKLPSDFRPLCKPFLDQNASDKFASMTFLSDTLDSIESFNRTIPNPIIPLKKSTHEFHVTRKTSLWKFGQGNHRSDLSVVPFAPGEERTPDNLPLTKEKVSPSKRRSSVTLCQYETKSGVECGFGVDGPVPGNTFGCTNDCNVSAQYQNCNQRNSLYYIAQQQRLNRRLNPDCRTRLPLDLSQGCLGGPCDNSWNGSQAFNPRSSWFTSRNSQDISLRLSNADMCRKAIHATVERWFGENLLMAQQCCGGQVDFSNNCAYNTSCTAPPTDSFPRSNVPAGTSYLSKQPIIPGDCVKESFGPGFSNMANNKTASMPDTQPGSLTITRTGEDIKRVDGTQTPGMMFQSPEMMSQSLGTMSQPPGMTTQPTTDPVSKTISAVRPSIGITKSSFRASLGVPGPQFPTVSKVLLLGPSSNEIRPTQTEVTKFATPEARMQDGPSSLGSFRAMNNNPDQQRTFEPAIQMKEGEFTNWTPKQNTSPQNAVNFIPALRTTNTFDNRSKIDMVQDSSPKVGETGIRLSYQNSGNRFPSDVSPEKRNDFLSNPFLRFQNKAADVASYPEEQQHKRTDTSFRPASQEETVIFSMTLPKYNSLNLSKMSNVVPRNCKENSSTNQTNKSAFKVVADFNANSTKKQNPPFKSEHQRDTPYTKKGPTASPKSPISEQFSETTPSDTTYTVVAPPPSPFMAKEDQQPSNGEPTAVRKFSLLPLARRRKFSVPEKEGSSFTSGKAVRTASSTFCVPVISKQQKFKWAERAGESKKLKPFFRRRRRKHAFIAECWESVSKSKLVESISSTSRIMTDHATAGHSYESQIPQSLCKRAPQALPYWNSSYIQGPSDVSLAQDVSSYPARHQGNPLNDPRIRSQQEDYSKQIPYSRYGARPGIQESLYGYHDACYEDYDEPCCDPTAYENPFPNSMVLQFPPTPQRNSLFRKQYSPMYPNSNYSPAYSHPMSYNFGRNRRSQDNFNFPLEDDPLSNDFRTVAEERQTTTTCEKTVLNPDNTVTSCKKICTVVNKVSHVVSNQETQCDDNDDPDYSNLLYEVADEGVSTVPRIPTSHKQKRTENVAAGFDEELESFKQRIQEIKRLTSNESLQAVQTRSKVSSGNDAEEKDHGVKQKYSTQYMSKGKQTENQDKLGVTEQVNASIQFSKSKFHFLKFLENGKWKPSVKSYEEMRTSMKRFPKPRKKCLEIGVVKDINTRKDRSNQKYQVASGINFESSVKELDPDNNESCDFEVQNLIPRPYLFNYGPTAKLVNDWDLARQRSLLASRQKKELRCDIFQNNKEAEKRIHKNSLQSDEELFLNHYRNRKAMGGFLVLPSVQMNRDSSWASHWEMPVSKHPRRSNSMLEETPSVVIHRRLWQNDARNTVFPKVANASIQTLKHDGAASVDFELRPKFSEEKDKISVGSLPTDAFNFELPRVSKSELDWSNSSKISVLQISAASIHYSTINCSNNDSNATKPESPGSPEGEEEDSETEYIIALSIFAAMAAVFLLMSFSTTSVIVGHAVYKRQQKKEEKGGSHHGGAAEISSDAEALIAPQSASPEESIFFPPNSISNTVHNRVKNLNKEFSHSAPK
ncbi:unnamed protein product [Cyprideis torosa]|uniref:Uncharacterized protein n=1 Tax=Cyprideis torosa TaxID=163714 RepID=A0A7R8ZRP2_9CRUS|nr:unnamed protein product [Cyprideis torosa]CAG0899517.1 unnamed protein product [Cyprideis torosa]